MTMNSQNYEFTMTLEEEACLILNDIFDGDSEAENFCLKTLSESKGLEYKSFSDAESLNMIVDYEDDLIEIAEDYYSSQE